MIGCFILLFVNDTSYSDVHFTRRLDETEQVFQKRMHPIINDADSSNFHKKYPCMCIVHCKGFHDDMVRFIGDRRGLYRKWRAGDRDPQDYMRVYRYFDEHQTSKKNLIINSVMVGSYSTPQIMLTLLNYYFSSYLTEYRAVFVDENIKKLEELLAKTKKMNEKPVEKELKSCLDEPVESLPINYCVKITPPVVPDVQDARVVANKRKTSQQRYREAHKEEIKERNRLYYLRCRAEMENAATSDAS